MQYHHKFLKREEVMEKLNKNRPSPAKEIACIAVETALLIGAQYAISPVMGV